MKKNLKKVSQCRKRTHWNFITSILSENIKKLKGGPSVKKNRKKSHRAENTLIEYLLAPLSFLDDVKNTSQAFGKVKVLHKQELMTHENCKKSGPFRVRL